eukprot:scaffold676_cov316-Pavlova_lutheri.AAC.36
MRFELTSVNHNVPGCFGCSRCPVGVLFHFGLSPNGQGLWLESLNSPQDTSDGWGPIPLQDLSVLREDALPSAIPLDDRNRWRRGTHTGARGP